MTLQNLNDNLNKCLDKRSSMTKSGVAASFLLKCKYFDEMAFLHKKSCNRPSESNLQLQSTFISAPPTPVYAKFQGKNKTNTMSQVSGFSCKKRKVDETEVHLMKQLSNTDNDIKKLLTESKPGDSLYSRSLVPMLEMLPLKKKRLPKIRITVVNFYMNYSLTKNVTKVNKILNVGCFSCICFIEKETLAQVFPCELCQISKNTFYTEHLLAAASVLNYNKN